MRCPSHNAGIIQRHIIAFRSIPDHMLWRVEPPLPRSKKGVENGRFVASGQGGGPSRIAADGGRLGAGPRRGRHHQDSLSGTMAISETTLKDTILMMIDDINKKGASWSRRWRRLWSTRRRTSRCSQRRLATDRERSRRGRVWLLDFGLAQVGAAGVRGAESPAVLHGPVRGRVKIAQHIIHRRRAQSASDPGGRIPDECKF